MICIGAHCLLLLFLLVSFSIHFTNSSTMIIPLGDPQEKFVLYLSMAAGAGLLVVIVVTIVIWVCLHKKGQAGKKFLNMGLFLNIS